MLLLRNQQDLSQNPKPGHLQYSGTANNDRLQQAHKLLLGLVLMRAFEPQICNLAPGNPPKGNNPAGNLSEQLLYFLAHTSPAAFVGRSFRSK